MRQQANLATESIPAPEAGMSTRSYEAIDYVTDLLLELETIAKLSGLTHLSGDIQTVVSKHRIVSGKA